MRAGIPAAWLRIVHALRRPLIALGRLRAPSYYRIPYDDAAVRRIERITGSLAQRLGYAPWNESPVPGPHLGDGRPHGGAVSDSATPPPASRDP